MNNQLFIPTDARKEKDIFRSLEIQKPLIDQGYSSGLMLVLFNGMQGILNDREIIYENLSKIKQEYDNQPIVTMLSNFPIDQVDFLQNPKESIDHIMTGIDFARGIPIGGQKIITFHNEVLIQKKTLRERDEFAWKHVFYKKIYPSFREISIYASNQGVEAKVETAPVPSFGDLPIDDDRAYGGIKLRNLRNPFYLTHQWGFEQVRASGLGICLDLCHSKTIYDSAASDDIEDLLHNSDKYSLKEKSLYDDVQFLDSTDIVHLNDGKGRFSTSGEIFYEGVPLGEGDIIDLPIIFRYLNTRHIPFVIEVNEKDFRQRENTKKSIVYISNLK